MGNIEKMDCLCEMLADGNIFEENEDGQEKTEEPSQRKLDKAAEDGKVLTSKEMFVFTGIAMLLAMISVLTLLPKLILIIRPFGQE